MSWCSSASSTRSSEEPTMSSAPSAARSRLCNSSWKCALPCPEAMDQSRLAELARDVLLRAGVVRVGEDLVGLGELHELAGEHERRLVRHAPGLLHVVRDDDDRVLALEVLD